METGIIFMREPLSGFSPVSTEFATFAVIPRTTYGCATRFVTSTKNSIAVFDAQKEPA
jgi:hypothetical protein